MELGLRSQPRVAPVSLMADQVTLACVAGEFPGDRDDNARVADRLRIALVAEFAAIDPFVTARANKISRHLCALIQVSASRFRDAPPFAHFQPVYRLGLPITSTKKAEPPLPELRALSGSSCKTSASSFPCSRAYGRASASGSRPGGSEAWGTHRREPRSPPRFPELDSVAVRCKTSKPLGKDGQSPLRSP